MILISGPCVLEDYDLAFGIAERLHGVCKGLGIDYVFKASFDKANRSRLGGYRGVGLCGLEWLALIRHNVECRVTTDFHTAEQLWNNRFGVDVIQVPSLLSRQTDLLVAAAETGHIVNLKKGQFMNHLDLPDALTKLAGAREVWVTDRGNCFGYGDLIVDFRRVRCVKDFGVKCIIDCSHPAGDRLSVPVLARAAIAAGADGVFIECHPDPDSAQCDGKTSMHLNDMGSLLQQLIGIESVVMGG